MNSVIYKSLKEDFLGFTNICYIKHILWTSREPFWSLKEREHFIIGWWDVCVCVCIFLLSWVTDESEAYKLLTFLPKQKKWYGAYKLQNYYNRNLNKQRRIRFRHVKQCCGRWRNLQYTPFICIGGLGAHGTLAPGLLTIKQEIWNQVVKPSPPPLHLSSIFPQITKTPQPCQAHKAHVPLSPKKRSTAVFLWIYFSNLHHIKKRIKKRIIKNENTHSS